MWYDYLIYKKNTNLARYLFKFLHFGWQFI